MPLNDNQRRFIAHYRSTTPRNATRAYEAVYKARGDAARKIASEYLTKPDIRAAIDALDAADLRDLGITAAALLRDVARLAFSDPRRLFEADGSLKPLHTLDDDLAPAVSGVDVTETMLSGPDETPILQRTSKVRLWNKPASQKLLAQYLRLITDEVDLGEKTINALVHRYGSRRNGDRTPV